MSDQYSVVLGASKKLEALLSSIGSEGRGLHGKCGSVEHLLPPDIVWSIRMVATIRNKLLHEDGFQLRDIGDFMHQAGSAIDYLEKASAPLVEQTGEKRSGLTITVPASLVGHTWPELNLARIEEMSKEAEEVIQELKAALRGLSDEISKMSEQTDSNNKIEP